MSLTLGHVFKAMPIPAAETRTTYFEAGPIRLGVEIRGVDGDFVSDQYRDASEAERAEIEAYKPEKPDSGVSLHVFSADGLERLRFDCFDDQPHYHYIDWDRREHLYVLFDSVANGDMTGWALDCLRDRLRPMLRAAGAHELADAVDDASLAAVLPHVQQACSDLTGEHSTEEGTR